MGRIQRLFRSVRFWWQRRARGWSDDELWNLDVTFANWVLPRLKAFRNGPAKRCYPGSLASVDEWLAILDEMISGFELLASPWYFSCMHDEEKKVERSFSLFAEWCSGIWY